jgi:hypothetical protein
MVRILIVSLALAVIAIVIDVRSAQAISRHNPYRSFNVSGYNYGSMQWERSHGKRSSWSPYRTRRFGWRRW